MHFCYSSFDQTPAGIPTGGWEVGGGKWEMGGAVEGPEEELRVSTG